MGEFSYKYLSTVEPSILFKNTAQETKPIHVIEKGMVAWHDLKSDTEQLFKTVAQKNPDLLDFDFDENIKSLVCGSFNLINNLINRAPDEQIDTLIFLDKSARNAAYLFQHGWDVAASILEKKGKEHLLPQKPNIRFINVGLFEDEKHCDSFCEKMLASIYREEDFYGRVMIVDEIVASGGSIRRAAQSLSRAGYLPSHIEGIANYDSLPSWYSRGNIKGIHDVGDISSDSRMTAAAMDDSEISLIQAAIKRHGWEDLMLAAELSTSPVLMVSSGNSASKRRGATVNLLDSAASLVRRYARNAQVPPDEIVRLIASRGGFLALPPNPDEIKATREYRKVLRYILKEAVNRGLVTFSRKKMSV